MKGSNHKTGATWNRSLALRLLRQHGELSRRQIAHMTGLRGSTLTYIVRDLVEIDALRTVGKKPSKTVGQKQVLLQINPDMGYTLGISLRQNEAQVLILDAAGHKVAAHILKTEGPPERLPDQLRSALDGWLMEPEGPRGRLLGIGVGAPGAIDASTGHILHSTALKADNTPLGELLAAKFGCSVLVDHDARLAAVAEATEGAGQNISHFLLFLINPHWHAPTLEFRSYGSALFLDGRVYRGAHSAAGEMDLLLAPRRDLMGDAADLAALTTPDAPLTPLLTEVGAMVADSVASIVNLLDVQRVILGGTFGVANVQLIDRIHTLVSQRLISGPDRQLEIVPSRGGAEGIARGAAISAFNLVLENGTLLNIPPAEAAAAV